MAKNKAYVVFRGITPGIYTDWATTSTMVQGQKGAVYKGYATMAEAESAWEQCKATGWMPYGSGSNAAADGKTVDKSTSTRTSGGKTTASDKKKSGSQSSAWSNFDKNAIPGEFYEIHTDGGALHNPGPGGYGFVILDRDMNILTEAYGAKADQTNNTMETTAILMAMKETPEGCTIDFRADSNYVYQGMQSWWANWDAKNLWSEKKNTDLIRPLWDMVKKRRVVYGPKDHAHQSKLADGKYAFPYNKICDKLSNYGEEDAAAGREGLFYLIKDGKVVDDRAILVADLDESYHGVTVNPDGERIVID